MSLGAAGCFERLGNTHSFFQLLSSVVLALLIGGHSPQAALAQEPTGATAETLTEATVDEDSETSVGADSDQPTEFGAHQAGGMIVLMQNEIQDGLRQRRIESTFAQFERFAKGKLQSSAYGRGGEVTGICRLGWYDHLMRNIIKAPAEAQDFTRDLHKAFASEHEGLDRALGLVAEKVDLATREASEFATIDSPEAAIDQVRRSLLESQMAFAAALDPPKSERDQPVLEQCLFDVHEWGIERPHVAEPWGSTVVLPDAGEDGP